MMMTDRVTRTTTITLEYAWSQWPEAMVESDRVLSPLLRGEEGLEFTHSRAHLSEEAEMALTAWFVIDVGRHSGYAEWIGGRWLLSAQIRSRT